MAFQTYTGLIIMGPATPSTIESVITVTAMRVICTGQIVVTDNAGNDVTDNAGNVVTPT